MVPDGVVCFFTSYGYLENVVSEWYKSGIIDAIMKNKLLFCESSDSLETANALGRATYNRIGYKKFFKPGTARLATKGGELC